MNKTEVATEHARVSGNRLPFVDSLRGIAALAVVGYHFYGNPRIHDQLSVITPRFVGSVLERGSLGVQVFFVLSGFVIAYSLRNSPINLFALGNFTVRRWLRLSPPYYATFGLVLAVDLLSNCVFPERVASLPQAKIILAHFLYLQDVFGFGSIVGVFWTLCIEMQLYLVFVLLLCFARKATPAAANACWSRPDLSLMAFALLTLFSLAEASGVTRLTRSEWFVPYWYMFFGGVLTCRVVEGKTPASLFWTLIVLVAIAAVGEAGMRAGMTGIVMLALYTCARNANISAILSARCLLYLGTISYSLYLVHQVVGRYCTHLALRVLGSAFPSIAASLTLVITSIVLSVLAAHLLYMFVEKPSIKLSGRLKIAAAKPPPRVALATERLCITQS